MDALTLVRQDHRKLEELLERCERLDGGSRGDSEVFRRFQAAVRHHVDQEETILYAIFRERARRAGVDLAALDRALEQHRLIDRLTSELADPDHDGDTRRAKLTVLAERVRTHLDDEDSVLLVQSNVPADILVPTELGKEGRRTGTFRDDAQSWLRYEGRPGEVSLVLVQEGRAIIVVGKTAAKNVEELAAALF